MLTRRDQLKLKEEKKNHKKEEQEKKKLEKQEQAEKKRAEAEQKKSEKATAKAKAKAKSPPEQKDADGLPEKPKRKRRNSKETEVDETKKDDDGGEQDERKKQDVQPKAKAKRSRTKKEPIPETEAIPEKEAPKAKAKTAPKRKAKAKSAPKTAQAQLPEDGEGTSPTTPKRRLFQSDDEEDGDAQGRVDPKTGKPLSEIVEDFMPELWEKTRPKKEQEKKDIPEEPLPKRRRRAKTTEKTEKSGKDGKPTLSPFAKKEVKRRKKADEAFMKSEIQEDETMQGICTQHFKKVKGLDYEGLKSYLTQNVENKIKGYYINAYWGKPAAGVKCLLLGDGTLKKAPEIAYFGRYGTASCWNINMTSTYISASLLVSWLRRSLLGNGGWLNSFSCLKSKKYSIRSTPCMMPLQNF